MHEELRETEEFWDSAASDWDIQVGDDGDGNRILNSDPVLWALTGDVSGLDVLDAGCGTGYLTRQMHTRRARVVGVDLSERMIAIARGKSPDIEYHVASCSHLSPIADISKDLIVSNYVLMDTPDLLGTLREFHRVLKPNANAVLVFSHPCFPAARSSADGTDIVYRWPFPYFEQNKCVDPPWGHFKVNFIWFHRPLSDYWKAFKSTGFDVVDFEEPRQNNGEKAFSVAFKLQKASS